MKKTVQYIFTSLFITILGIGGYVLGATTFVDQFGGWGVQGGFNLGNSTYTSDSNGNIYVADSNNSRIQKFDSNGILLYSKGIPGSGNGQFNYPTIVRISISGDIYVLDNGNNRIQKFDNNLNYISQFGSFGSGNGQFNGLSNIIIDNNYIYAIDSLNNRIQKFDSNGNYISQFGSQGNGNGQFNYPSNLTIDINGNLYVIDSNNYRIQKFDSTGDYISQFGSLGNGNGQFNGLYHINIGSGGNIYVSDANNDRIQIFDFNGNYISQFGSSGQGNGQFGQISSMAIDSGNNIYITDSSVFNNRIQKFDSNGNYISQFGSLGNGNGQFDFPLGIIINNSLGKLYIGDVNNNRIQITDFSGNYLGQFNGYTSETQGKLNYPIDTKIYNNKVYVTDKDNDRIQIYSLTGVYLGYFGSLGTGDGQFNGPFDMTIDTGGNIYVSDNGNNRIQKFNSNGNYISQFNAPDNSNGQINGPFDITIDTGGNIYVSDNMDYRIQKFSYSGVFLSQFGSNGNGNGQFASLGGFDIDSNNNIYVIDSLIGRIQKFDSNGNYISQFGSLGNGNGQFNNPGDIAIDNDNNIYITDPGNNRIQKFDSNGNYISQFNSTPSIGGLGIDKINNILYVTDTQNSIIKRYRYSVPTLQPLIKSYSTGQINPILTGIAGLSGDIITIYSGSSILRTGQVGSGNMRTLTLPVTLSTGSLIFPWKLTDSENNSSTLSTITIAIDNTGAVVTLSGSSTMTVNQNSVFVDLGARWTDNIDGSGNILTGTASGTALNTSVIGTYYLKYSYTDRAGNTGNTITRTISVVPAPVVVTPPTSTPSGSSGGGGGGGGLVIDNCPVNEDYSPSYYDKTCGTKPTPIISPIPQSIEDITTNFGYPRPLPIVTRTIKTSVGSKSSSCDTYREDGYSEDLYNSSSSRSKDMFVICWMFDNKMTNSNTLDSFQGSNVLRRDASTKFFYNFITNVLFIDPITINTSCNYNDLKDSKVDLLGYIKQSCNIGLYKGSDTNKNFFPRETFKKGRFSIVMSNVTTLYNADTSDASKPSLNSIKELQNKDARITRIEAAHALYKLSNML